MIISHRHKFIFLKTVKTGGTSVEIALSRYCGEEDVITPISPEDEPAREELGISPRNYLAPRATYWLPDYYRLLVQKQEKKLFWNHITAQDVRDRVGAEIWDNYFKFTIERNPWDKTVSDYYWRASRGGPQSLDAYFRKFRGRFRHFNYPRYSLNGQLAVDAIVRFEHLIPDLTAVLQQVGIAFDGVLPRAKGSSRKDRRHYSELLSPAQQQIIAREFAQEIELLGYQLESAATPARAAA